MVAYHCQACNYTTTNTNTWKAHGKSPKHAAGLRCARIAALPEIGDKLLPIQYRPMVRGLVQNSQVNPLANRGYVPKSGKAASSFMKGQLMDLAAPIYADILTTLLKKDQQERQERGLPEAIRHKMAAASDRAERTAIRQEEEAAKEMRIRQLRKKASQEAYLAAKEQMDKDHAQENARRLKLLAEQRQKQVNDEKDKERKKQLNGFFGEVLHPAIRHLAKNTRPNLHPNIFRRGERAFGRIWWSRHVVFSSRFKGLTGQLPLQMASKCINQQVRLTDAEVQRHYQHGVSLNWFPPAEIQSDPEDMLYPDILNRPLVTVHEPYVPVPRRQITLLNTVVGGVDEDGYHASQADQDEQLQHIRRIQFEKTMGNKKFSAKTMKIIQNRRKNFPTKKESEEDAVNQLRDKILGYAKMKDPALQVAFMKFEIQLLPSINEFMRGASPLRKFKEIYARWNKIGSKAKKLAILQRD